MSKPARDAASASVNQGSFDFVKVNALPGDWRELYYWLLTLRGRDFALFLVAVFLAVNLVFAGLYRLGGACVEGMTPGSFADAFFFSVETLATVGYGHMYPATPYGHVVATVELMVGMAGIAVMTGLIFVRFSRPTERLVFSRVLVIGTHNGLPALMMRVGNQRQQPMAEAEFRLMFVRHEPTTEDPTLFQFHDLPLQVNHLIVFPAAITMRHLIDERSPLHGITPEELERVEARFMASVVCLDKVLHTRVQSDQNYTAAEVRFHTRFAEMYEDREDGRLVVDYARLHDTEPLGSAS